MADSPEQHPMDKRERRQRLRRKGWTLCLEGLGLAGLGGLIMLVFRWVFELVGYHTDAVAYGTFIFALWLFIAGLVNIVKGWDSSGGNNIS